MKHLLIGFLVVFSTTLCAEVIQVKKMERDRDLDRSFVLKTNLPDKVVLDCQSFIQGLMIGEGGAGYTFMMDPDACMALQGRIRTSTLKFQSHCIDVEQDIRADYPCH